MKSMRFLIALFALVALAAGTAFAAGVAPEAPAAPEAVPEAEAPIQDLFVPEALQTSGPPIIPGCQGQPMDDCFCSTYYEPVCGCNGVTYSNSCFAACDGVKEYTAGSC